MWLFIRIVDHFNGSTFLLQFSYRTFWLYQLSLALTQCYTKVFISGFNEICSKGGSSHIQRANCVTKFIRPQFEFHLTLLLNFHLVFPICVIRYVGKPKIPFYGWYCFVVYFRDIFSFITFITITTINNIPRLTLCGFHIAALVLVLTMSMYH